MHGGPRVAWSLLGLRGARLGIDVGGHGLPVDLFAAPRAGLAHQAGQAQKTLTLNL
jgi:hypothetical protein